MPRLDGKEGMTNHEKTTVVEQLFGNYSFIENVLVNLGLESVVVSSRARALGHRVSPVVSSEEEAAYKNVTLSGSNIDWD